MIVDLLFVEIIPQRDVWTNRVTTCLEELMHGNFRNMHIIYCSHF